MTLANASLEPMWLVATHLYDPVSLNLTRAISSFPSFVVSAPAGRLALPTRLHTKWMGWEPWARHCRRSESPGWSLTWSGRQVAYGGAIWRRRPLLLTCAVTKDMDGQYLCYCLFCPLTVHLHLRVRLTVAMYVGCVTDVLSWVLAPHAGQRQNTTNHCVFPWQRCSELGPRDDRRRGTWNEEEKARAKWKMRYESRTGWYLSILTSYHWPDTPLWLYVPQPLSFLQRSL